MDDKIEAWRQEAERLCVNLVSRRFAMADTDLPDDEFMAAPLRYQETLAEFRAHLRTTPEGYRLVPVEPTDAMLQAEIDAVSDYWFDYEGLGNGTEATKIGYKAMLAASQESGT
jgi:hypothetical protein